MDGDYAGIKIVMDIFDDQISLVMAVVFLKWCASCSLLFQPNDLQVCFMMIRRYLHSKEYENDKAKAQVAPYWLPRLQKFLSDNNLSKGSVDAYVSGLPFLYMAMQKTYTMQNITSGWRMSQVRNPIGLLDRCPQVQQLSAERRADLIDRVMQLAVDNFAKGSVTDEDIRSAGIADFFDAKSIVDVSGRPLNGQRALCLTSEAAKNLKQQLANLCKKKKEELSKKAVSVGLLKAAQGAVANNEVVSARGPPPAAVWGCARSGCATRAKSDAWRGCPVDGCGFWHCCGSKACLDEHKAHSAKHLAHVADQH